MLKKELVQSCLKDKIKMLFPGLKFVHKKKTMEKNTNRNL